MKFSHSLHLYATDRGAHTRQIEAFEQLLLQAPQAVVVRLFGETGTPSDLALAYSAIMEEAMRNGTRLILCAYTHLIGPDVSIWLTSPWRFMLRGATIMIPPTRAQETFSGPLLTEARPEDLLESAAYAQVLARIGKHCDLASLLGRLIDAGQCSRLGLSTGLLDQQITRAMREPAAGAATPGR